MRFILLLLMPFTLLQADDMIDTLEKDIAYFFGVEDEKAVSDLYLHALSHIGTSEMMPYLEDAYLSVKQQRNWNFDHRLAAVYEFQIIQGNSNGASFEVIKDLMVQLYQTVYQTNSPLIDKAARLRTFLYQYKASITIVTEEDRKVMLQIANASQEILDSIK